MLDSRLITILTLCQTKSFTKTAKQLYITQPAVSHHIKFLEDFYQTKLYEYNNRKFQLTPSGEILYQFVNSVNSDSERLKAQLPSLSTNVPELRIGAEQSAGESFLPHLIISFLKEMPKCKLKIVSENYSSLSTMLDNGDLDFFLFDGVVSTTKYDYHELGVGNVICVCSPSHPLAEKEVSICAKDSGGPYNYDFTTELIQTAKEAGIAYAVDVYPSYGSDVEAALKSGFDVRHGLIGPGVYASHGYERGHVDGMMNAFGLLVAYLDK